MPVACAFRVSASWLSWSCPRRLSVEERLGVEDRVGGVESAGQS